MPSHDPAPPAASHAPVDPKRALVIGASSGIGAALVRELVSRGYRVGAVARREPELQALRAEHPEHIIVRSHDVTDTDSVQSTFEELVRDLGGLDLLVYASGVMPAVGREEYDTAQDHVQVAVNLAGAMAWCNEVARLFQTQRAGCLVGISSVAGDRGRKENPAYHATKAGFSTYLESLRNRLSEVGVRVVTIKPGPVETPMTADLGKLPFQITAEAAARTIVGASEGSFWSTRYVPLRWWPIMSVIKAIPSRLFRHLNI